MKKYVLRNSGKEFKIGDTVDVTVTVNTPFGEAKCVKKVVVNEQTLGLLIKEGLVIVKDDNYFLKPVMRKIARRLKCSLEEAELFVKVVAHVSTYAALQTLLEQFSKKLNSEGDFNSAQTLFYVNPNGEVVSCMNKGVHEGPLFTSREQAEQTLSLVYEYFESLYGEQEDNKRNSN